MSKLPVYTLVDLRGYKQRIVHYERLLLPFGTNGSTVDGVMLCLEISSPEGPFDTRDLMNPPAKGPAMGLCATILQ